MASQAPSIQRSFRISSDTMKMLDAQAKASGQTRNALVDRLLTEGVRLERHPLIRFHTGAAGLRRPKLVGTRLYIYQIISTVRDGGGSVDEAAEYFSLPVSHVQAAVDYYAEFREEIDKETLEEFAWERAEFDRWERSQQAMD